MKESFEVGATCFRIELLLCWLIRLQLYFPAPSKEDVYISIRVLWYFFKGGGGRACSSSRETAVVLGELVVARLSFDENFGFFGPGRMSPRANSAFFLTQENGVKITTPGAGRTKGRRRQSCTILGFLSFLSRIICVEIVSVISFFDQSTTYVRTNDCGLLRWENTTGPAVCVNNVPTATQPQRGGGQQAFEIQVMKRRGTG